MEVFDFWDERGPMNKTVLVAAIACSALIFTSACGGSSDTDPGAAEESSVAATAEETPTPEPTSPEEPAEVAAQFYETLEDLRDAYAATGVDCSDWVQTDSYSEALSSGSCSDNDLLAIFVDNEAVLMSVETTAESLYNLESDTEISLLVGDNWRITTDDAEGLALKLGGEPVVITADSYSGAVGADQAQSDYSGDTISDGTWLVGLDFPAGSYTLAESPLELCYWGIYEGGTNQDEIIANEIVQGGYPTVVLKDGQEFESTDCGVWITEPEARRQTEFGDGIWTVGRDVRAGKYRVTEPVVDNCYWAVLEAETNGDNILSNDLLGSGRPNVSLKKGQEFETADCGTWARM